MSTKKYEQQSEKKCIKQPLKINIEGETPQMIKKEKKKV